MLHDKYILFYENVHHVNMMPPPPTTLGDDTISLQEFVLFKKFEELKKKCSTPSLFLATWK